MVVILIACIFAVDEVVVVIGIVGDSSKQCKRLYGIGAGAIAGACIPSGTRDSIASDQAL